jgi:hypothetical protein
VERILWSEICITCPKAGRRYESFWSLNFLFTWRGYLDYKSIWEPGTSLEHTSKLIDKLYVNNFKAPALITGGQVWRRGGTTFRDIRNENGYINTLWTYDNIILYHVIKNNLFSIPKHYLIINLPHWMHLWDIFLKIEQWQGHLSMSLGNMM